MKINDNGTDRDMTESELAYITQAQKQAQADSKTVSDFLASQEAAKSSARAKLLALGLTEAEVKALVG